MRQTLIYISLDAPFSILPNGTADKPILHIGLGLILLGLMLVYAVWFFLKGQHHLQKFSNEKENRKAKKNQNEKPQSKMAPLISAAIQLGGVGLAAYFFSPVRVFPVYGYGTMLLVAFVAGASWAGRRADKVGIDRDVVWDAAMSILISGILGARAFYLIQKREDVFKEVTSLQDYLFRIVNLSDGGLVLYGGVILGTMTYFTFCKIRQVRPLQLADVITPSIFLGIGFGRIGCLLNGCCYGDRCDLPWAITFPAGSVPYEIMLRYGFIDPNSVVSLPLHPTQIYSSIGGFILAFLTATVFKYRRHVGEVFAVGAIFYPINRFLIEFVRGDEFTQMDTGLTISQLVSIAVLIAGLVYLVYLETSSIHSGKTEQTQGGHS